MIDPSGHDFGLGDILLSAGIDSELNSIEFTGFSAAFKTVQGVEEGENANQIFEGFLIDQAVGAAIGLGAGLALGAFGALRNGVDLGAFFDDISSVFSSSEQVATLSATDVGDVLRVRKAGHSWHSSSGQNNA